MMGTSTMDHVLFMDVVLRECVVLVTWVLDILLMHNTSRKYLYYNIPNSITVRIIIKLSLA